MASNLDEPKFMDGLEPMDLSLGEGSLAEVPEVISSVPEGDVVDLEIEGETQDAPEMRGDNLGKPMNEEDISHYVKKDLDRAKSYHSNFDSNFRKNYNAYHAVIDARYNMEGRSQVVSSDVMDTIESIMPSLMRIFASADDICVIQPIGAEDVESAGLHQELLNYQFTYKMDGFTKFYTWFKDALVYGIGIIKVTWSDEYTKKSFVYESMPEEDFLLLSDEKNVSIEAFKEYDVVETSIDSEGNEIQSTSKMYRDVRGFVKKMMYAGPIIECIPPSSFYIEPGARSVKEANFVAHRVKRTMDYLRRMEREGIYHNVDKLIPHAEGDSEQVEYDTYLYIESQTNGEAMEESEKVDAPGREEFWVWECYTKLDVDGDGLLENLLITMVGDTVLRVQENPFDHGEPPFEVLVPIIDTHKFYGISITDLVSEFQRMKTALLRNVFDNMSFGVNNFFLVRRESGTDVKSLANLRPGSIIFTDDPNNSIRELQPQALPAYTFNLLEYMDGMRESRTGVTKYNQGMDSRSLNHTATGISAIMSAAQQRLEMIARLFAETGVKNLFRKMISLNQQFIDSEFVVRLFNKELKISQDSLDGSFDLKVTVGVGAGLQDIKVQQYQNLLNILPSLSQMGLVQPSHVYHVVTNLLKAMGIKDVDSFIQAPQAQPPATPQGNMPPPPANNPQTLMNGAPVVNPTAKGGAPIG